jgi:microcystin-dependent protein
MTSINHEPEIEVITIEVPPPVVEVINLMVPGQQGPPGLFDLGTVTTGAPGTDASAVLHSQVDGHQTIDLIVPRGDIGAQGPPNVLNIGAVSTGAAGSSASVTVTGTSPTQTLNLNIPRGDKGDKGDQGIQGIQGIKGDTGLTGPKGDQGIQGVKGDIGLTGPKGDQGIQGVKGDKGDQGIQGIQGLQGIQGIKGDTGSTGAAGPANVLTIGTVANGSSAAATLTGTSPSQVLNLTLPQGIQGVQGVKGDQGIQGIQGVQGPVGEVSQSSLTSQLATFKTTMLNTIYPVGAIYMSTASTNPAAALGGTWVAWGSGQVPVGFDSTQTEFSTVEQTGGTKTVTLTAAQSGLPAHNHIQDAHNHTQNSHNHTQNAHNHIDGWAGVNAAASYGVIGSQPTGNLNSQGGQSTENHALTSSTTATNNAATATNIATTATNQANAAANASAAHNNLQPYIVCYMWKRTA